jgi:hypothetical protein
MSLFALQGLVILLLYARLGWNASPEALPLGLQLDPLHGVVHLISGLIGAYFGFLRPAGAARFIQVFAIFYLGLAVFGTFTHMHFGMQLELPEKQPALDAGPAGGRDWFWAGSAEGHRARPHVAPQKEDNIKQVLLIHWDAPEAQARVARLESMGYSASYLNRTGPALLREIKANLPSAVLIDLSRLPSQGTRCGGGAAPQRAHARHPDRVYRRPAGKGAGGPPDPAGRDVQHLDTPGRGPA